MYCDAEVRAPRNLPEDKQYSEASRFATIDHTTTGKLYIF